MTYTRHVCPPPRTSPDEPQNLLRPSNKGCNRSAQFIDGNGLRSFAGLPALSYAGGVGRVIPAGHAGAAVRAGALGQILTEAGLGASAGDVCRGITEGMDFAADMAAIWGTSKTSQQTADSLRAGSNYGSQYCPSQTTTVGTNTTKDPAADYQQRVDEANARAQAAELDARFAALQSQSGGGSALSTNTLLIAGGVLIAAVLLLKA